MGKGRGWLFQALVFIFLYFYFNKYGVVLFRGFGVFFYIPGKVCEFVVSRVHGD